VRTSFGGGKLSGALVLERVTAVAVGHHIAGPGLKRPPDPTKGPCRWKAPQDVTSHLLSRGDGHGGLGGFFAQKSNSFGNSVIEEEATEVSEARSQQAPWEENAHAFVARYLQGSLAARGNKASACLACDPLKRSRVS